MHRLFPPPLAASRDGASFDRRRHASDAPLFVGGTGGGGGGALVLECVAQLPFLGEIEDLPKDEVPKGCRK